MAGYCIGLLKYMRIDENLQKKEKLIEKRKNIIDNMEPSDEHRKFLAYGEFDRIGFERVVKFPKFRDISDKIKIWVGDRETLLVYDIPEPYDIPENIEVSQKKYKDTVFYDEGNFYIENENGRFRSEQLFLGITVLQFKDSQKENRARMGDFLYCCKNNILKLVDKENLDVQCSVLGTLGSFGLAIIWLADQYSDVLYLVNKIRSVDIGTDQLSNKSIFLSAYTIFAQNHRWGEGWDKKIKKIMGESVLRLTLKRGASKEILKSLEKWKIDGSEICHSAGEYDIIMRIETANAFTLFSDGGELNYQNDFVKENVLQSNLQLCVDTNNGMNDGFVCDIEIEKIETDSLEQKKSETLPELEQIQEEYKKLREQLKSEFPSTAGMVDTLDWLYSDYIAKVSVASNEMWVSDFSYQFLTILSYLTKYMEDLQANNKDRIYVLEIIDDLLSNFERQISHIAESNNLILGTPVCQFRYSGQNNLTLYTYFGIIKSILKAVYERQEVSVQAEIVPLIVADVVPIIKSSIFSEHNSDKNNTRIITINLPMMSLYDPICYYPYLLHEIFHYIVPKDRAIRNGILGCMYSTIIFDLLWQKILVSRLQLQTAQDKTMLENFLKENVFPDCHIFMSGYYNKYMKDNFSDFDTYNTVDEKTLIAERYEEKLFDQWLVWFNEETNIDLNNNPVYLYICDICSKKDEFIKKAKSWKIKRLKKGEGLDETINNIVNQMISFVESLNGIANNSVKESQDSNFANLMSCIDEQVFDIARMMKDAVKEALIDIQMVSASNMNLAEYLLLFTKIKKELLLNYDTTQTPIQDVLRIGMVLDFIISKDEDEIFVDSLEGSKETFLDMYCGLYHSTQKSDTSAEVENKPYQDGANWFSYLKNCFQIYLVRYRAYVKFFQEIETQLLAVGKEKESLINCAANEYWKKYIKALTEYGHYMRSHNVQENKEHWLEMKTNINSKIFELNIKFIHSFQYQETFSELNKIRNKRIVDTRAKQYENWNYLYKEYEAVKISTFSYKLGKRKHHVWEYEVSDVGELGNLTATIAKELKKSCGRLLGKNKYPIWYRGQQSVDYKLVPSIMRKYKSQKAKQKNAKNFSLISFIRKEFGEFRFEADGFQEAFERGSYTESDYLALMQHYSTASNFLDWTENALSALYFALEGFLDEKVEKTDKDAALYIFSPVLYNHARRKMIAKVDEEDKRKLQLEEDVVKTIQDDGIPNLTVSFNKGKFEMYLLGKDDYKDVNCVSFQNEIERNKKLPYYLPVAIYVSRLNKRIQAQNGIFLAYNNYTSPDEKDGFDYIALENIQDYYFKTFAEDEDICPFLYKIAIKKEEREKIALWVDAFGMTKDKCYPELSNVGEKIMK